MSKYIEKQEDGTEVTRWTKQKHWTKEKNKEQWQEAEKEVKQGKVICITDLA